MSATRKLAAILAADVVGHTCMTGRRRKIPSLVAKR
jgi:hypothetical protein